VFRGFFCMGWICSSTGNSSKHQQFTLTLSHTVCFGHTSVGTMDRYNVLSFNVRGLNSQFKRSKLLDFLHRKKPDIALLQETHLNDTLRLQNRRYKMVAASSDGSSTKGVAVLMRRNLTINIIKVSSDVTGRLAFCCTSIERRKAFISIYAPAIFVLFFFRTFQKSC